MVEFTSSLFLPEFSQHRSDTRKLLRLPYFGEENWQVRMINDSDIIALTKELRDSEAKSLDGRHSSADLQ
jgi:hypothetical protein